MKKALVLIDYIGCPRNMLLKLRIEDYLKANGWSLASPSEIKSCDLVTFCTCGVTYPEQRRDFQIIRAVNERIADLNDAPMFIVTGCLPPINKKELVQIHNGPAFGPRDLDQFDILINATTRIADIPNRSQVMTSERVKTVIERQKYVAVFKLLDMVQRTNATIRQAYYKIFKRYLPHDPQSILPFDHYQMGDDTWCVITSTGCLGNCSYCSIKTAKGRLKSRHPQEIIKESRQGVGLGCKWIALIADDNGVYGRDIGTNLVALLRELSAIEGDFSILIDSLSPKDFIEFFDELMGVFTLGKIKRICLAMQHVNPRILSSMNRSYDVDVLKQRLRTLATALPTFAIDAHVIVGYPGETEQEFEELASFVEWLLKLNPSNEFKIFA